MPEFPPNLPLEDVLLFPLSSKSVNYDSDLESSKGDYSEYSSRREETTNRTGVPPQMVRSTYEWDKNSKPIACGSGGSFMDSQHASELSHSHPELGWVTLPRRCDRHAEPSQASECVPTKPHDSLTSPIVSTNPAVEQHSSLNTSNNDAVRAQTSISGISEDEPPLVLLTKESTANQQINGHEPPSGRYLNSPGYYHVKQLLNEESLYHDARLANEIANVRLREEARIRDDKMRGDQRLHEKPQVPLQPPNSDMYSPREEKPTTQMNMFSNPQTSLDDGTPVKYPRGSSLPRPVVAPKPQIYTEDVVRNRWQDSAISETASRTESPSLISNISVLNAQRQLGSNGLPNGHPSTSSNSSGQCQPSEVQRSIETNRNRSPRKNDVTSHTSREAGGNVTTTSNEPTIVEETNAVVDSEGGVLSCPVSGVELRIPKGAIPAGEKHEIYVKVCRDGDSPPIDKSKGETLLSPLVMCGPQGLNFLTPCELRLPHCGPVEPDGQWSFSLKAGEGGEWQHMDVQPQKSSGPSEKPFLSVLITHF